MAETMLLGFDPCMRLATCCIYLRFSVRYMCSSCSVVGQRSYRLSTESAGLLRSPLEPDRATEVGSGVYPRMLL